MLKDTLHYIAFVKNSLCWLLNNNYDGTLTFKDGPLRQRVHTADMISKTHYQSVGNIP